MKHMKQSLNTLKLIQCSNKVKQYQKTVLVYGEN
jgi:hypothetical protein